MTDGKHICGELKNIRRKIAEENGIALDIPECTFTGECRGTCPRCESEVRFLERELARRIHLGKAATVAGLALALSAGNSQAQSTETQRTCDRKTHPTAAKPDAKPGSIRHGTILVGEPKPMEGDPSEMSEGPNGERDEVFAFVEEMPEFPGGVDSMDAFIEKNIRFPESMLQNQISGKVYVQFVVEKDGTLSNVRVLRDIGGGCGTEALRLVRCMPQWKPGKQNGKPVRCQYTLPIRFYPDRSGEESNTSSEQVAPAAKDECQGVIKGYVKDAESGEPLPFANVAVYKDGIMVGGTQTDFDGLFALKNLKPGKYDVKFRFVGYSSEDRRVTVKKKAPTYVYIDMEMNSILSEGLLMIESIPPLIEIDATPNNNVEIQGVNLRIQY